MKGGTKMCRFVLIMLLYLCMTIVLPEVALAKSGSSIHWFAGVLVPCASYVPPNLLVGSFFGLRMNRWSFKLEPNFYGGAVSGAPYACFPLTINYTLVDVSCRFSLGGGISYASYSVQVNSTWVRKEGIVPLLEGIFNWPPDSLAQIELNGKYFFINGEDIGLGLGSFWPTIGVRFEW